MTTLRPSPYIWPTLISAILSGEANCSYVAWFQAHFKDYEKRPSNFDLAQWRADHGEMVRNRAEALREAGYTVWVEYQNQFTVQGRVATLAGKADIVALRDVSGAPDATGLEYDAVVIDLKSGKPRDKDCWQVMLYMWLLPLSHEGVFGARLRGQVEYRGDHVVEIAADKLTDDAKRMMRSVIDSVAGSNPLPAIPSFNECRFCDLMKADCKQRMEAPAEQPVTTDLW